MALLSVSDVDYYVANKEILSNINLDINNDEIITIVGPNGSGKSSLINIALGLIKPSAGRVTRQPKLRIGYVPQSINRDYTLPLSVFEFISLTKFSVKRRVINELLDELMIAHLADALLNQLSGGELRRVLFARALLNHPRLLVLDEPTAGIDVNGQARFYKQLNEFRARYEFSVLMVSHDLHFVMATTDRVVCLNRHICCSGVPEQIVKNPSYTDLFSQYDCAVLADEVVDGISDEIAFYQHRHDHSHDYPHTELSKMGCSHQDNKNEASTNNKSTDKPIEDQPIGHKQREDKE